MLPMSRIQPPKRIVMLAFEGSQILDVVGPLQMFAAVNDERPSGSPAYEITILAEKAGSLRTSGGLDLVADGAYRSLPRSLHTLVVSGGNIRGALRDPELARAVRTGATRADRVVSICSGTFFLAAAGLLDGKRATTHWSVVELLARTYPEITVEADALYVRDGNLWSSAGVTAGMDLALALIREDFGGDVALAVARRHVLFLMRPGGQSQFSAHLASESQSEGRLAPLLRWIPEHIDQSIDVSSLAARARMSERSFARSFAKEVGETPARYVERARLDAARRMLSASDLPLASIAARAGFKSEERMRRAFQRSLSISPGAFRARFRIPGEKR
jgi:transcriptional regulator GlxA family with amidase domain